MDFENNHKIFELRLYWKDAIKMMLAGLFLFISLVFGIIWLIYPFFVSENIWDNLSNMSLLILGTIWGFPLLIYFVIVLSFSFIHTAFYDFLRLKKYNGLLYKLDGEGFTYFEDNKYFQKKWSDISDVGCFKQSDKKIKILYKYQIKFIDGTFHEFDLRGSYPTIGFKEIIEEYWLHYNS